MWRKPQQQEQPQKTWETEQENVKLFSAISTEKLTDNFTNNGEFNNVNKKVLNLYIAGIIAWAESNIKF